MTVSDRINRVEKNTFLLKLERRTAAISPNSRSFENSREGQRELI